MSRDGSGNMSIPYPDFVNGTTADADQVDANNSDIVSEITNSIAADGQTTPTANLKMGGFKHTGVANASDDTEYAAWGQVKNNIDSNVAQSGSIVWGGTAGGTADALTLTLTPALSAYAAGNSFTFIAASDNAGAATVDINGLGTKALQFDGAALTGGEIVTGKLYQIDYDGTQFQVTRVSGYVDNSVTLDKLDDTGTDGYVLTAKGAGVDPAWELPTDVIDAVEVTKTQYIELDLDFDNWEANEVIFDNVYASGSTGTIRYMKAQVSEDGGTSWISSGYDSVELFSGSSTPSTSVTSAASQFNMGFTDRGRGYGYAGCVTFTSRERVGNYRTNMTGPVKGSNASGDPRTWALAGQLSHSTAKANKIRFYWDVNNFEAEGRISVVGKGRK